MADILHIHPVDPQARLLSRVTESLHSGGVIIYPTDSSYAFGCRLGDKSALERIRRIRQTERDHDFTLVCKDLSELAVYARVENWAYRLMKSLTPGPFTFILRATGEVPKRIQDRKKTIGIRVPDNRVAMSLLESLGEPIMSSTLLLPGDELPLSEPDEIADRLDRLVDVIVAGAAGGIEPTTVVDLTGGQLKVIRRGAGDISAFED